jgi:hypothetical protein
MTKSEKSEIIRVCGADYEESDVPAYIRNREAKETQKWGKFVEDVMELDEYVREGKLETVESAIPIIQGRDSYSKAAQDHAERISK